MIKRGLTLDNALNITPRISINDDAGSQAGCTTGRARAPVWDDGQGLAAGKLGRRSPEAAWAAKRSRGGDERPPGWFRCAHQNLWHVGADLVSAGWLTLEFDGRRRKRVLVKIIRE